MSNQPRGARVIRHTPSPDTRRPRYKNRSAFHERTLVSVSPLPVRVDPWGTLHAVPDHGATFGNRGILHDRDRQIIRGWQGRRWIICRTEFRGRDREVLPVGGYTGLFFRDEATALAAGHRPCFECRRADAQVVSRRSLDALVSTTALDDALHRERLADDARPRNGLRAGRRLHPPLSGADVEGAIAISSDDSIVVLCDGAWRRWSFGALGDAVEPVTLVGLLTPPTAIAALSAGYRPTDVPLIADPFARLSVR